MHSNKAHDTANNSVMALFYQLHMILSQTFLRFICFDEASEDPPGGGIWPNPLQAHLISTETSMSRTRTPSAPYNMYRMDVFFPRPVALTNRSPLPHSLSFFSCLALSMRERALPSLQDGSPFASAQPPRVGRPAL